MTLEELNIILEQTGYPVTYSHFSKPQTPPFITYLVTFSSNVFADDKVHKKIENAQIELYTNKKDITAENVLELLLDSNEIPYEVAETYIDSEKLYQRIYEVSL
jgi:hypothetical protein